MDSYLLGLLLLGFGNFNPKYTVFKLGLDLIRIYNGILLFTPLLKNKFRNTEGWYKWL